MPTKSMVSMTCQLVLVSLVLAACGSVSNPSGYTWPTPADRTLPPPHEMAAWLDAEPTDIEDRLLRSYALEAAGDDDAALSVLAEAASPTGDAWLDVAVALRVYALREQSISFEEVALQPALALSDDQTVDPTARLLWQSIEVVILGREHRYDMLQGTFDGGALGAPATWSSAGPLQSYAALTVGDRLAVESEERLPETVALPSGPVHVEQVISRISGATPGTHNGVHLLESAIDVAGAGRVLFHVATNAPFVLLIDGQEAATRTTRERYGAQERWVVANLSEGAHSVRVRTIARGTPVVVQAVPLDDTVQVRDFDAAVVGGGVQEVSFETPYTLDERMVGTTPSPDGLQWLVAATVAEQTQAAERAQWLVESVVDAPVHPVLAYQAAAIAGQMHTVELAVRSEFVLAASQQALDGWSGAYGAEYLLASQLLQDGAFGRAETHFDALALTLGDDFRVHLGRAAIFEHLDAYEPQYQALRRAALAFPRHCPTVQRVVSMRLERGESMGPDDVPSDWLGCDATWIAIAKRHLLPRGETEEALAIGLRTVRRNPGRGYAAFALNLATAMGDDGVYDQILAVEEGAGDRFIRDARRADRALATGDRSAASAALDDIVESAPTSLGDLGARAVLDRVPLLADYRHDGTDIVRDYMAAEPTYDAAVVYVYDYALSRVYESGDMIELVHQIVQVQTREALGELGEVGIPGNASLLTARVIKPDGRWRIPDDIPGKDSISMPNLERGDFIELEWVVASTSSRAEQPSMRTPRFYFAGFSGPFHHSVVDYVFPSSLEPLVAFDVRGDGVRTERTAADDVVTLRAESEGAVVPVMEARAVHEAEWLPSARASFGYTWDDAQRSYAAVLEPLVAPTTNIHTTAMELTEGARTDRERLRRIFRFVSDEITDFGGFFSTPASWTLESGEGERAPLFMALAQAAGFEPQLVFVRPWDQDQIESPVPDISVFDLTAVRVALDDGDEVWLEPDFERYPFDYIRSDGADSDAVVVYGPDAGARLRTPVLRPDHETTTIDVRITLDANGDADVVIHERVPMRTSHGIRMMVQSSDDERLLARQVEGVMASSFGSISDLELTFSALEDPDAPVDMTYQFQVTDFGRASGSRIAVERDPLPRPLETWYASRDERTTDLLIASPVHETLTVRVIPPAGWAPQVEETAVGDAWENVEWAQTLRTDGDDIVYERRIELPIRRVSAEAYPAFAEMLVNRAMVDALRFAFTNEDAR